MEQLLAVLVVLAVVGVIAVLVVQELLDKALQAVRVQAILVKAAMDLLAVEEEAFVAL